MSENAPEKMLRICAEDPMWPHQAEVSKSLLLRAAAELEALRKDAERYRWLRDDLFSDWAICEWCMDHYDGIGYYRDTRAPHVVDAAIDAAMASQKA